MSERFDLIYGELVREHGIASAVDIAIGKLLAEELLKDHPDVDTVLRLRAALPPRVETKPAAQRWDFARLSDGDMAELAWIAEKACTPTAAEVAAKARMQEDQEIDRSRRNAVLPLN